MPRSSNTVSKAESALERVTKHRERIIVRRNGKKVAALVSLQDLAALEQMEERLDADDFLAAKAKWERGGKKTVPWQKLKVELSL